VTRDACQRRYEAAIRMVLDPEQVRQVMDDPAATWLWRSLREAGAAGFDSAEGVRQAARSRPLGHAGSIAKVLGWRIWQQIAGMPALAARPWCKQVTATGDPAWTVTGQGLAEAMAGRQRRLGEHAAEQPPAWAHALRAVPEEPVSRAGWEHTAGLVARYRERWGYAHPHEPIGPSAASTHPGA
jgi:hypothetical protein